MNSNKLFTLTRTVIPAFRLQPSRRYSSAQKKPEAVKSEPSDTKPNRRKNPVETQKPWESHSQADILQKQMQSLVISQVNNQIVSKTHGKLFCVIYICGKQYKVCENDLVVVQGYWAPNIGDKIRLEKIMLVGSSDFTLIGRPVLPLDQVAVHATVIEKTFSHLKTWFKFIPRENNYHRTHLHRTPLSFLRINSIELINNVNELGDTDGFKERTF